MRPAPIPDEVLEQHPGEHRLVVGPPGQDLDSDIAPVEAMYSRDGVGRPTLSVRCVLEEGDLEMLQAGAPLWITFVGRMPPFGLRVGL